MYFKKAKRNVRESWYRFTFNFVKLKVKGDWLSEYGIGFQFFLNNGYTSAQDLFKASEARLEY